MYATGHVAYSYGGMVYVVVYAPPVKMAAIFRAVASGCLRNLACRLHIAGLHDLTAGAPEL